KRNSIIQGVPVRRRKLAPLYAVLCFKTGNRYVTESEEVNSIINESGNSFHCSVANYLREKGWHTMVSPYYMDASSNKPREIDLIAEKSWKYEDRWEGKYGTVNLKLFIEC